MARIYSNSNRIKFTDIPERYAVPRGFKAKQSEVHSAVVAHVFEHFKDTKKYKEKVLSAINYLTYCVMNNEIPPFNWTSKDPFETMPDVDMELVEKTLGDLYIPLEAIEWDVTPSENNSEVYPDKFSLDDDPRPVQGTSVKNSEEVKPVQEVKRKPSLNQYLSKSKQSVQPTPKEDLYIQPPRFPRFDVSKVWLSANIGGDQLVVYETIPEIPTKQNEISITTKVDAMTDSELMALYPNQLIRTRAPKLYEQFDGIDYDEDLGSILPVEGFTKDQIVDNIIKYPHLYRIRKYGDDETITKFFSTIEINGELVPTEEVWDTLPEAQIIPRESELVKEYVIRRYLLEKSAGVHHKYNIVGGLDPFLTLFMPAQKYVERGYSDTLAIVKQCVRSRVSYKQTRNPILRRLEKNV